MTVLRSGRRYQWRASPKTIGDLSQSWICSQIVREQSIVRTGPQTTQHFNPTTGAVPKLVAARARPVHIFLGEDTTVARQRVRSDVVSLIDYCLIGRRRRPPPNEGERSVPRIAVICQARRLMKGLRGFCLRCRHSLHLAAPHSDSQNRRLEAGNPDPGLCLLSTITANFERRAQSGGRSACVGVSMRLRRRSAS